MAPGDLGPVSRPRDRFLIGFEQRVALSEGFARS